MDKKLITAILIFLSTSLILSGCVQQPPPSSKPSPFPMKLTYTTQVAGQNTEMIYYLDNETNCSGRDAVLGLTTIQQVESATGGPKAEITVYLDKGEFVGSKWQQGSDLSSDTAQRQLTDIDFMLLLNQIFNAAGKNFMNDPVWNSTEPTILNDVTVFGWTQNISIMKIGESTSKVLPSSLNFPCTEFSVTVKGLSLSLEHFNVCVAHITDTNPLPYVVYVKPKEGEHGLNWTLESVYPITFGLDYQGIIIYPQCLSPVICPKVNLPTADDENACNQQNGSIQEIIDSRNCVTEYKCMSQNQIAETLITNNEASGCGASQQLIDAVVACRGQHKNVSFNMSSWGCVTALQCQ